MGHYSILVYLTHPGQLSLVIPPYIGIVNTGTLRPPLGKKRRVMCDSRPSFLFPVTGLYIVAISRVSSTDVGDMLAYW